MTKLKLAIDVSMLAIGMELKERNCCSVCSMNDGQFVIFQCVFVIRCGVGVRRVIMIRRWSEGNVCTVRHRVFCFSVGEQKVMSGEDVW